MFVNMKTGYLGDSCAIEMYISKNYLYKYMYFFVQNKLKVCLFSWIKLIMCCICWLLMPQTLGKRDDDERKKKNWPSVFGWNFFVVLFALSQIGLVWEYRSRERCIAVSWCSSWIQITMKMVNTLDVVRVWSLVI